MEYKSMRKVYKGNIWEIENPDFIGMDKSGNYQYKFDKTIVISSNVTG